MIGNHNLHDMIDTWQRKGLSWIWHLLLRMLVLAPPSQDNRSAFWVRTSLTLSNRYFLSLPSWEKKISTWKSAQKFDFLLFMYMVLSHSFLNEIPSSVVISPYRKLIRMPQLPSWKSSKHVGNLGFQCGFPGKETPFLMI